MEKIEQIYEEVKRIDALDKCTTSDAVCKFTEEYGELVREINKTTGRKTTDESQEEILDNIKEEAEPGTGIKRCTDNNFASACYPLQNHPQQSRANNQ